MLKYCRSEGGSTKAKANRTTGEQNLKGKNV
jgi:hypothetical protein